MKKPSIGIIDILSSPWAIMPEKLQEISAVYKRHLRGEKADIAAIEASIGKPLDNARKVYETRDGVAILPIEGVISKRMNLFTQISGGISTQLFQRDLQQALNDSEVHSIILLVDSPGGTVDGTQAAANAIRSARNQKPIVTVADGLMASAGYWIGSAADQVYIVDDTTQVGSIGVVATHEDWSKYEEKMGVKTTEITAGKYKRIASEFAPLTPEGKASIQERVDQIYTVFVNEVAANRGVTVDTVLKDMADGRLFMGQKSVENGLVDGIKTLDEVISLLNDSKLSQAAASAKAARVMVPTNQEKERCTMDLKTLKEQHPDLVAAITKEATADMDAKLATARSEGATAERERIQAVRAQLVPGHESLIEEMAFDGKTTGPEAAVKVIAAENTARAQAAKDFQADAPNPAEQAPADQTGKAPQTVEEKAKAEWDKSEDLRAEFAGNFDTYLAFVQEDPGVKIKVLKGGRE